MRVGLAALILAGLASSAFAGPRLVVSSLPEAVRPFAEVETNVVFATGAATENKWTLSIERDASVSNCVEVVFGRDVNEDGVLAIEEGELCVGWDCGEWFWRDRRANAACRVGGGHSTSRHDTLPQPRPRGEVAGLFGIPAGRVAHVLQSRLGSCSCCLARRGVHTCREQDFD